MPNNKEILTRAIKKAISSGWDCHDILHGQLKTLELTSNVMSGFPALDIQMENKDRIWRFGGLNLLDILFDKDFAKALWGKEQRTTLQLVKKGQPLENWEYELINMVIAPNPIAYLGEHI